MKPNEHWVTVYHQLIKECALSSAPAFPIESFIQQIQADATKPPIDTPVKWVNFEGKQLFGTTRTPVNEWGGVCVELPKIGKRRLVMVPAAILEPYTPPKKSFWAWLLGL